MKLEQEERERAERVERLGEEAGALGRELVAAGEPVLGGYLLSVAGVILSGDATLVWAAYGATVGPQKEWLALMGTKPS